MRTLPLVFVANHMFVDLPEGRWLIDTGSPSTFGAPGFITWDGVRRTVPQRLGPVGMPEIQRHVATPFVGLIGGDLLNAQASCWDGPRGEFRLHDTNVGEGAVEIDYEDLLGAPIVRARLGRHDARCILDTGAQFGYILTERFAEGGTDDGRIEDFNPLLGAINCRAWLIEANMNGVQFTERVGHLSGLAGITLGAFGIDAILGCSWLPPRCVWYQPQRKRLAIAPIA